MCFYLSKFTDFDSEANSPDAEVNDKKIDKFLTVMMPL